MPSEVIRLETVRKQKPAHGVQDGAAIRRKEGMRNYERVREWREGKGREDKGRERKRTEGNQGKGREDEVRLDKNGRHFSP